MTPREEIKLLDNQRKDAEQRIKEIISDDVRNLLKKAEKENKLERISDEIVALNFHDVVRHVGTDRVDNIWYHEGNDFVIVFTKREMWGKHLETYQVTEQIEIYNIIEQKINS